MSAEVAKAGFYLRTYDRDIFLNKRQQKVLYSAMDSGAEYFDLKDGHRIMMHQVKEILPAFEYQKSAEGGHYCSRHPENFVPKFKTCGYC